MKIIELVNHIQLAITNEQADLLGRFQLDPQISKSSLDEREQVIANQLTSLDILLRQNYNGQTTYTKKIR
jgi:hypothetical protein